MAGRRFGWSRVALLQLFLGVNLMMMPPTEARRLRFVTLLYRHGDRSPVKTYPKDPYQEDEWPQGFGQLTKEGMLQHWELGQALRQRYHDFLNTSYHRQEVYVRSTDFDRTLMSAEANLAGLFPPDGMQRFNPNISWQPIPIHTVPIAEDRLLKFPLGPCPRFEQLQNETRRTPEYQNESIQNAQFLDMVANATGLADLTLETVWNVYDTLFCEAHGLVLPPWASPQTMKRLSRLKDFSFRFLFGIYEQAEKARLQGGVLLAQIRRNLTLMATTSRLPKLLVYSAHDTTLVALQMALDVYNGKQAPYASCHIFELYQEDSGNFSVEMYFRNESTKAPWPLILPGCPHHCPLQDFLRLTEPVVPKDWEQECRLASGPADTGVPACSLVQAATWSRPFHSHPGSISPHLHADPGAQRYRPAGSVSSQSLRNTSWAHVLLQLPLLSSLPFSGVKSFKGLPRLWRHCLTAHSLRLTLGSLVSPATPWKPLLSRTNDLLLPKPVTNS
ncbi:lysosomal acid phosphatase isoform X2 [Kogia breviceps]|uniref:lysosomal acid phosphatase isoform X2 n=1 Tax=Kogia breviceps TaxID=27615 RepID=UPI0034D20C90